MIFYKDTQRFEIYDFEYIFISFGRHDAGKCDLQSNDRVNESHECDYCLQD